MRIRTMVEIATCGKAAAGGTVDPSAMVVALQEGSNWRLVEVQEASENTPTAP